LPEAIIWLCIARCEASSEVGFTALSAMISYDAQSSRMRITEPFSIGRRARSRIRLLVPLQKK